ncbi:hypothetical protein LZ32DRAFT_610335 [Colletotrichum eremochloae]|nr:hypothetical protein LZ32DRAFT_610335 [Colletotrichum eremochloae]
MKTALWQLEHLGHSLPPYLRHLYPRLIRFHWIAGAQHEQKAHWNTETALTLFSRWVGGDHHRIQTGANYHARKHREGTDAPSTFTHLGLRGNSSI